MKWCLFFCSLFLTYTANADTYYIDAISSTESESKLIGELSQTLANSYVKAGHNVTANRFSADWVIEPTLIKEKNSYTLSIAKSNEKAAVFRSSLKAKSKKDLSDVANELVQRSLLFNEGNLEKSASNEPDRNAVYRLGPKTKSRFYVGLGYGGGDGIDAEDNQGLSWSVGYLHMLNRYIGAKFNVEGVTLSSSDGNMGSVTTGFQFYPLKRRHSPYLSTLVGYAWTNSGSLAADDCTVLCDQLNNINESGFGANLAIGYHFFRNKPLHFGVELYYTTAFYDVNDQAPESYGGRLILYWK
jgi:hypothetical protein